jgi:hypothetical protein
MKRSVNFIVTILFLALLGGCASSGQSGAGHFYHRQESDNLYVIGFNGNVSKNTQRTNDFAMYLAAEIGRRLGFSCFVINSPQSGSENRNPGIWPETRRPVRFNDSRNQASGQTVSSSSGVSRPGIEFKVLYSKRAPKGRARDVFVIRDVIRQVRTKYNINT